MELSLGSANVFGSSSSKDEPDQQLPGEPLIVQFIDLVTST